MRNISTNGTPNHERGFTLVEMAIVAALFIIISGFIFTLFLATVRTAAAQDAIIGMRDEARLTAQKTSQLLRGAFTSTVAGVDLDGNDVSINGLNAQAVQLTFEYPMDTDGDLVISSNAESSGTMTLGLDLNDANGDGRTTTQIILLDADGDVLSVLSNRAVPLDIDAAGGFIVTNVGGGRFQVDISLRSATAGSTWPMSVTESRVFERKNTN